MLCQMTFLNSEVSRAQSYFLGPILETFPRCSTVACTQGAIMRWGFQFILLYMKSPLSLFYHRMMSLYVFGFLAKPTLQNHNQPHFAPILVCHCFIKSNGSLSLVDTFLSIFRSCCKSTAQRVHLILHSSVHSHS